MYRVSVEDIYTAIDVLMSMTICLLYVGGLLSFRCIFAEENFQPKPVDVLVLAV